MRGDRVDVAPAPLHGIVIAQSARAADLDQVVHGGAQHPHRIGEVAPQQEPLFERHLGIVRARDHEAAPRQELRGVDLRGDLGDADLHRHVLGDVEGRVGQVALPRPLHEIRIGAAREPERRPQQRIGVHGDERGAVDRRRIDLRARRAGVAQGAEGDATVLRHEHIVERHGVRARAAQAGAIPSVEHLEVRDRHKE